MLTTSRSFARSILIVGALFVASAPAFAQKAGGDGRGEAPGEAGGGSDIYGLILKDPAKLSPNCITHVCAEPRNPRPRLTRRSKAQEACRSHTPMRDPTTGQMMIFNSCPARNG